MTATGRRIFKASLVVMAAHLIFKFAGLVQARVIGHYADEVTRDLFTFGFESILITFYLVGEEGLGPAFLPIFMEQKEKESEGAGWRFAGTLLSVQTVLIVLVGGLVMLNPEAVVRLFTDWDSAGANPVYMQRAPFYARWMIPGLFGLSIGSTTYLLLNGYKRFFLAAFGDAAVKFVLIGTILFGALTERDLGTWLCIGVIAGSLAKVATHLIGLRDKVAQLRPNFDVNSPAFRRFTLLVLPLLIGIIFAKVRDIYNDTWVLSTTGEAGLVSVNAWGKKIFRAFGWLVPYAGSIAMFPFFCELVDKDNKPELAKLVTTGCQIITVICVPLAAGVIALSLPLTRLIYQGGHFDLEACRLAATANAYYTLVLPFFALEFVFMQAYFSNRKMITPIALGLIFSALSMAISYVGVVAWGYSGAAAITTVALAFTISRCVKTISLAVLMKRFLPDLSGLHAISFAVRMLIAGGACGAAAWGVRVLYESRVDVNSIAEKGAVVMKVGPVLVLGGLAGAAAYLLVLRVLCGKEWAETIAWTRARMADRRASRDKAKTPEA